MKNNKKVKNAFRDIYVSPNLERKILNMTINKEKQGNKRFKFAYLLFALLITCMISVSVVYAKEIKEIINNWTSSITFKDGTQMKISDYITYVKIKDNAIKTKEFDSMISMNSEEVEKMLGIKLLKSNLATSDIIGYKTGLNEDDTIGRIDLWLADYIHYEEEKYISMSIAFLNKNADKGYILAFEEGLDATASKDLKNLYHINSINADAVIYKNEWSKERLTVTFLYNNMVYSIIGNNVSAEEMIQILNSLQ